jgi:BirA family biotin operon repressor/biotin-[acetyl-CoA-carboxylase] ligase
LQNLILNDKNNQIFSTSLMNTLFAGQNSIPLTTVDSTNSYASAILRHATPPEGTLIYTFDQRNGRGQRGSFWESVPNKNVALSLILYPGFLSAGQQFLLTKMCSLAVSDLMAEMLQDDRNIRIKWPNDVYVKDRKIAGILVENALRGSQIQSSILGIGFNVNQLVFETTQRATSLAAVAGKEFDLKTCLDRLCELLEGRYLQLKGGRTEELDRMYLQRLYRFREQRRFVHGSIVFEGSIQGVDEQGKLLVTDPSGEQKGYDMKEIRFEDH